MTASLGAVSPLLTGTTDARLLRDFFPGCGPARVALQDADRVIGQLGKHTIWLDPGLDGLLETKVYAGYHSHLNAISAAELVRNKVPFRRPSVYRETFTRVTELALNHCHRYRPAWITVPQLPLKVKGGFGGANVVFAEAASDWRRNSAYSGELVLPVILAQPACSRRRTERTPLIRAVADCARAATADRVWVVDSSLRDYGGEAALQRRMAGLIAFHEELKQALPSVRLMAGPYWALNLVLWAKRLIDGPVVAVGSGFQYHTPGAAPQKAKHRIAITPLRRLAMPTQALGAWIHEVLKIKAGDEQRARIATLRKAASHLQTYERSHIAWRRQVATFYGKWLAHIAASPPAGRALTLYQDFSSAYVFGADLPPLPDEDTEAARKANSVAQQFMNLVL